MSQNIRLAATLLVVAATAVIAERWDVAVTVGQDVDFLSRNGTLINKIKIPEAVMLEALAYDDVGDVTFFSDTKGNNSILSLDLSDASSQPKSLLSRQERSHISSMTYHAQSRTLYWTDTIRRELMKLKISESGEKKVPVALHSLPQRNPRGIAVDVCNRHLYWTNSDMVNATIERSHLDGSNRVTIIARDIYEPVGIAIDNEARKLYWVDDQEGIHYKIERSNLDGSDRETVLSGTHQQPTYLAVDRDNIYWTDWASDKVWVLAKHSPEDKPRLFRSYQQEELRPVSVIVRQPTECVDLQSLTRPDEKRADDEFAYAISANNNKAEDARKGMCSNDGQFDDVGKVCRCKPGFSGSKCEVSVCHNYCLNGGQCLIENGKPKCKCNYLNTTRCEKSGVDFIEFCALFCMSEHSVLNHTYELLCRCVEKERVLQQVIGYSSLLDYNVLVPFLGALIAVLSGIIGVLSFYINKLKRRPRIKRRYVVNRTGVTPLTSRPQLSGEQCEITIENCCNMNICETPCFEPKLRNTLPSTLKKDEKNSLLDNMENNIF